jgi:type IV secretion system protein VirB8
MKKQTREALNAYYVEADSWAHDRVDALQVSRRNAWRIAFGAGLIAVLEAIALVVLMPLKTVEPYTLLVDRQTGFVQGLKPIDVERIAPDRALTQSFLVQYVIARESFDIDSLPDNYRKVALWSSGRARADYVASAQISNPDSPLARYPRATIVETRVKSVSPVGRDVAMVRFETRRRDAGGQVGPPSAWVAVIRYGYSGEPMSVEDRFVNPLGFQVTRYQRNAEVLQPEQTAPAVAAPQVQILPAPTATSPVQTQPARPTQPEPEL